MIIVAVFIFFLYLENTTAWSSLPRIITTPVEKVTGIVQHPLVKSKSSPTQTGDQTQTELKDKEYKSGQNPVLQVNGGKSTLNMQNWKYDHVVYHNIDLLNRTTKGTLGYLEPKNVTNDTLRAEQDIEPSGWHQKYVDGQPIVNRGHLIAYSISKGIDKDGDFDPSQEAGDQDNIKNLFTQTAFSNQRIETIYESKVRETLEQGHKVIYEAKPVFKGSEQMARGVHLQAVNDDGSVNFNVYIFNVQPHVQFNYLTGRSKIKRDFQVPTPQGAPQFNN